MHNIRNIFLVPRNTDLTWLGGYLAFSSRVERFDANLKKASCSFAVHRQEYDRNTRASRREPHTDDSFHPDREGLAKTKKNAVVMETCARIGTGTDLPVSTGGALGNSLPQATMFQFCAECGSEILVIEASKL